MLSMTSTVTCPVCGCSAINNGKCCACHYDTHVVYNPNAVVCSNGLKDLNDKIKSLNLKFE